MVTSTMKQYENIKSHKQKAIWYALLEFKALTHKKQEQESVLPKSFIVFTGRPIWIQSSSQLSPFLEFIQLDSNSGLTIN